MIAIRQGKTFRLELEVTNEQGEPQELLGAKAVYAYLVKSGAEEAVVSNICDIDDNIVSFTLDAETTAELIGEYTLEVKVRDASGNVDDIFADRFTVLKSILPVFPLQ